jgi:hypothetical protein
MDPQAGPMVVTNGVTNYVGLVDMVVDLGNEPGNQAHPYNYSDMTGFNQRVVNPGLQPLKGYWTVVQDSGIADEFWQRVSWNASLTNGCSVEVYIRAANDRGTLARADYLAVSNGVPVTGVNGRYIEVRLALTRTNAAQLPAVHDLTLHGLSSSFNSDAYLDDARQYETQDAEFTPYVWGPEPMTYRWFVQYPWMNSRDWEEVAGATNSTFVMANVDSWVDWTLAGVEVTSATGESVWLNPPWFAPARLDVAPLIAFLPASGNSGAASRYPMTINVFGQPTNLNSVVVTLWGLSHTRSADLSCLLLSPSGKSIILTRHSRNQGFLVNREACLNLHLLPPLLLQSNF